MEQEHHADHAAQNDGKGIDFLRRRRKDEILYASCSQAGGGKRETESFLNRVYQGSVSMLLNSFVEKRKLTPGEIRKLREILDQAEEKNEH